LSQQAPEDGCCVRISDEQLKQVFLNLVLNAIQAMPEGGKIFADFEKRRGEAVIAIRDTGPGVKEKDTEKIFDPFFSTKRGGTGLGLSIVWRILAKHSGTITLAPRSGSPRGACFVITLPQCGDAEKIALRA
jgi:signal transduction histidine kinase